MILAPFARFGIIAALAGFAAIPSHAQQANDYTPASFSETALPSEDKPGPWGESSYTFAFKVSKSLFKTINLQRTKKGLDELEPDPSLGRLAGYYSTDMMTGDFFGHFAPDGRDLNARIADAQLGNVYETVAEILWDVTDENIQWFVEDTVRNAVTDWLRSPDGHREALLDPDLKVAGVGTSIREERVVITMLLGRR